MRLFLQGAGVATLVTLAVFVMGTGTAESKPRNRSAGTAAAHDTLQDLPMPHPSSRRTAGPKHYGHHDFKMGRPQDTSGGNGQKLTRQRKF